VAYSKGMLPGAAARVAAICSLALTVGVARAERRAVAVVDVPGDPATAKLAGEIAKELGDHAALRNVLNYSEDLRGQLVDEDADALKRARDQKTKAEELLAPPKFDFKAAALEAERGEEELRGATPSDAVLVLYADLAFVQGQAQLGMKKPKDAAAAFGLVHRLSPGRTLDPGVYLPELIKAFDDAANLPTQTATLMVKGSGRVWIDGIERGPPGPYEVPIGFHVVWLTGPDRLTRGWQGEVVLGPANPVAQIPDVPADDRVKVRRARIALRTATDATARAAAMRQLATLVNVHEAVLLTMSNGKVIFQTWRDKAPGFSALREIKDEPPREVLYVLAPPPRKVQKPPPLPPIEYTPRWYRRRTVQVSTAVGVALVVGAYVVSTYFGAGTVPIDGAGFPVPEVQSR